MIVIKKKIIFGITSIDFGGAERVLVDIANKLSDKYDITIFSIYSNGEMEKELNANIKRKSIYDCKYEQLNKLQKMWSPIRILFFVKSLYKKYIKNDFDVEISFLEGPITRLFSTKNNRTKKIAWIHNDINHVFGKGIKSTLKKIIDKKIYDKYDKLVFVSKDNMDSFKNVYSNIDESRMQVIYNYIDRDLVIKKANESTNVELNQNNNIKLVTVCRLVEQKAIDRFIKVHSKLIKNGFNHEVYVIGDGPERERLERIIKQEGVEKTFKLLGKKSNPYPYIKFADYFCLLSYFEGYGMVLEEAKILNKRIIITDTAAREAVEGYSNSVILDNDEDSIYSGLSKEISCGRLNNEEDICNYDNLHIVDEIKSIIET